jgi:hypothetical protein
VPAAFHGVAAFVYLFVGTIGLYLAWRLLTGHIRAFADLQLLSVVGATLSFIAILFGNWLYIFYRAKAPDSARILLGLSFFYLVVAFGLGAAVTKLRSA